MGFCFFVCLFALLCFVLKSSVLCKIKPQGWKLAASVLRIFPTFSFKRSVQSILGPPQCGHARLAGGLISIERLTKHAPRLLKKTVFLGAWAWGRAATSQNYPEQHRFCAFPDTRRPESIKQVENLKITFVQGIEGKERKRTRSGKAL